LHRATDAKNSSAGLVIIIGKVKITDRWF